MGEESVLSLKDDGKLTRGREQSVAGRAACVAGDPLVPRRLGETCGKDPFSGPWFPHQQSGWGRKGLALAIGPGHSDMKTDSFMSYTLISYQIFPPAKE